MASSGLVGQGLAIAVIMALSRIVTRSQLGAYQQLSLLYTIAAPLLIGGIPTALLYFVPRAEDTADARQWIGEAYLLLGILGAAATAVIALAHRPLASAIGNAQLSGPLIVYAPYALLAFLSAVASPALVAVGRAGLAATVGLVSGVLLVACLLGATLVGHEPEYLAGGLVAAQAAACVISLTAVLKTVGISLRKDRLLSGASAVLRYGLPLALTGLTGTLAYQFDRIVVSHDFAPALYAVYAIGAVELPLTVIVQQAVNTVLVPELARYHKAGDLDGLAAVWRRAIRRSSLVLLPLFVFFMLTAPTLVRLLFGDAYAKSATVFRIYLCLVPLRIATYGIITQAIGRTKVNLSAAVIMLGLNAVLVLALVGPMGLPGPAVATVLATFAIAFYYLVRLRTILGIGLRQLFPWRVVAQFLGLSVLAGIPVAACITLQVHGPLQLPLAALAYTLTYVALLVRTGLLQADERAVLKRMTFRTRGPAQSGAAT